MAAVARRWIACKTSLWYRYITDMAIRCFGANSEQDSWCVEHDLYLTDTWIKLLPESCAQQRFAELHVLDYYRHDQIAQVVALFQPQQIMRRYVSSDGYIHFLRKVSQKWRLQAHTPPSSAVDAVDHDATLDRLDALFFGQVVLGHLNQRLRTVMMKERVGNASEELQSWYKAILIVVCNSISLLRFSFLIWHSVSTMYTCVPMFCGGRSTEIW